VKHFCPVHELATQSEPLTEEDGTTHQGRRIRLIGEGWPNSLRMIKDYSDEELEEWVPTLNELAQQSEQAYAFFNNNATSPDGSGGRMAQAAANAKQLQQLLQAAKVPVNAPT